MKTTKTMMIAALLVSLSLNMYGFLVSNQSCKAFANQCDEVEGASMQSLSIGQLIPIAGGYFLQSESDFKIVLKKIELSETDLTESLNSAIQNMAAANAKYFELWETSKSMEYNPVSIEKLAMFDYNRYKIENNLNPAIFQQVEDLLKPGLVGDVYKKHFEDSRHILEKMEALHKSLESGKNVDISSYWRLNQLYLEFAFFGQYTSEVFINLE